ncbi:MAG TPA: two-component sensor histidine kinase [Candidatus Blautia avicola]|uniref:histidine kinase n=1 Tax=Candidatus Blautia avicola TaxID=2838483 RepID=A0A9D2QTW9_9FIRM|nr:two-component sensor histidine kinase [Candidatus Blautia avicola]
MQIKSKLSFFKSLRFRIMVLMIMIGIIPGFIVEGMLISSYEDRAVELRQINVRNQCDILGNQLMKEGYLQQKSEVIDSELSMISSIFSARVLIINRNGRIVEDTYDIDEGKYAFSEEVIQCFEGVNTSYYDKGNTYIEQTIPLTNKESEQIDGVMLISASTVEIQDTMEILAHRGNLLMLIISILVIFLSFIISKILVKPFSRVSKAIEELTDGYLDEEISVTDYTETEMITNVFNKLLKRMKILDDSRQEFVANVSHELKTPMTSIKVLADSLAGQDNVPAELYKEFMQDITVEIDRENKIITDLLALVKMDKKASDLNIQKVSINELLENILKRLKPIADKKRVELVLESFRPVVAEIDEVKLSLAFSNLVENGIKYNVEDGWVHVTLNADHKYFYVTVSDSGIGIPKESIDKIFERFYRVDKSHSREIGGTGLGLAITRNAIVMHRGAIKVKSEEHQGTTFSVRIPLNYIA